MAHANAIFLSLLSGAALVLGLAPGCGSSAPQPAVALVWTVSQGPNGAGTCGAVFDTFSIGNIPSSGTIVTASNGGTYGAPDSGAAVPVTVQCTVAPDSGGFSVQAFVQYGALGTLTINGQINASGNTKPGTQTNVTGQFSDGIGLAGASMTDADCTVTFTDNANMGIAATRIWGTIDCPHETATNGNSAAVNCDGHAQFLFENCGQ
jgi:hypothetical protein